MSITVKDCMSLPSLQMGSVIAGSKGLSGIVSSVTVLEFDLTSDDIFVPNELAITAFYEVRNSVPEQIETIKAAKRSGIVALVLFYSNMVLHGVDPKVIETANKCNLPLILLPGENMGLKYSDVIHDITEAIFLDAHSEDFYIDNTLDRISQMDENHRSLDTVLGIISEYNRSSVMLCNAHNQVLGYALWPTGNQLDIEHILPEENVEPFPENILAYDFKIKGDAPLKLYFVNPFAPISRNILSETAQIIQLYTSIWNVNLNTKHRESIIPLLLENKISAAFEIAERNGIKAEDFSSLLIFSENENIATLKSIISEFDHCAVTDRYKDTIISLLTLDLSGVKGRLLVDELSNACSSQLYVLSEKNIADSACSYYLQFCKAANIIQLIYPERKIIMADSLRFANHCIDLQIGDSRDAQYYKSLLAPLHKDKGDDLLLTLQTYLLDSDSSAKHTAENLFIHRNTVKYRLDRIRDLLGRDFETMPFYYDVYLATALTRV